VHLLIVSFPSVFATVWNQSGIPLANYLSTQLLKAKKKTLALRNYVHAGSTSEAPAFLLQTP